jgi:hypothetical protein
MEAEVICCPKFNPEPWDRKEFAWDKKLFLKDRVRSLFHIPMNFGAVMKRNVALIEAAGAKSDDMVVLSDENSLWGSDVYIAVTKPVPGARMAELSGTFHSRVFEGPYSKTSAWIKEMTEYLTKQGRAIRKLYFYYTTCPKCAKKYGKNYVAIIAEL